MSQGSAAEARAAEPPATAGRRSPIAYFVVLVLVNLMWAFQFSGAKIATERLGPITVTFLTMAIATVLFAPFVSFRRQKRPAAPQVPLWRRAAALAAAGREARLLPGAGQVVVTDDEAADAYTLPGMPCRIVITAGMLRALSQPERQVLLAHERAHASSLHYLFTTVARLAAAANPLLRPVATAVGYTVERWADERAAAVTGDRQLAARDLHALLVSARAAATS